MIGERVAVLRRAKVGEDPMGEPLYEWTSEEVEGCLVRPLSGADAAEAKRPDGVTVRYDVALPKTYTATMAPLVHARIALVDRGMDPSDPDAALRVSGYPDVTRPCPTAWDVIASVGRTDG